MEWLRKVIDQIKTQWGKWSITQKTIFISIGVGAIVLVVLLIALSSRPTTVPLFVSPITDEVLLERISLRLDEENVGHSVTADGRIFVDDMKTKRKTVNLLVREDLMPEEKPWDIFAMDRWTVTDFERKVNLRQTIERNLELFIEALDEVDSAEVTLVIPEDELFIEDQNPVSASIIITPAPGSDIEENRKKLEGIVRLVKLGVEGLDDEHIVLTNHRSIILNDFESLSSIDELELVKRQLQQKRLLENTDKQAILSELQSVFGGDRVRVIGLQIELNFDKEISDTTEFFPIEKIPEDPTTPYPDRQTDPNVLRSRELVDESFEGTGFNPEGPPGVEGQVPPAYNELDGVVGYWKNNSSVENYEINERTTHLEKSPWQLTRKTVSIAIDGMWKWIYDDKGNVEINPDGSIAREYTPVPDDDLRKATELVQAAIGFDRARGDQVTVKHLQFDRTDEHIDEDAQFRNQSRVRQTVLYSLIGLAGVVAAFVAFRLISRELERRRPLREEELSRQHQAMREAALRTAEEEGVEVEMSVEERARLEMQENAINMAREHPEDVAQLIRTWLVEE